MPVIAAAMAGAMFLAVLRMDVIRMRLALAQSFEKELRLEDEKRELTVAMRKLRDPAVLSRKAERLGFRRAERLIDLAPDRPAAEPADTRRDVAPTVPEATPTRLAAADRGRRGVRP